MLCCPDQLLTAVDTDMKSGCLFRESPSVDTLVCRSFSLTVVVALGLYGLLRSLRQKVCSPRTCLLNMPCRSMIMDRFAIATGLPLTQSLSLLITNLNGPGYGGLACFVGSSGYHDFNNATAASLVSRFVLIITPWTAVALS